MEEALEFLVLGRLEIRGRRGELLVAASRKQRVLLAVLLLHANQSVGRDRLVDLLWGDTPPRSAVANLHTYVARLRKLFATAASAGHGGAEDPDVRLRAEGGGYALGVAPNELDLLRFEHLVGQGRQALVCGRYAQAAELLTRALGLWRGRPLEDVPIPVEMAPAVAQLEDKHLAVVEDCVEARLALGQHADLTAEVRALTEAHPLRERLWTQRMLAEYRAGRRVDALASYRHLYRILNDQVGISPGEAAQRLHGQILAADPALKPPPALDATAPHQLPIGVRGFVGREDEVARLDGIVRAVGYQQEQTAAVVCVVSGTAGVGKTALAVHWAHRVADRYPDGQLYVDLRGFAPDGRGMMASECLRLFFDALNVPPKRIPLALEARASAYRSLLASRRMLILLDNARDVEQVRPLLPGTPGCVVLITSRNRLGGLAVNEGAHQISLDLLSDDDATAMLARRLGGDRLASEPEAVKSIIDGCARLPLALAIVAARVGGRPRFTLAGIVDELRTRGVLDALSGGDAGIDVRAVFSWSYQVLSSDAAGLMRLLALHPGPAVGVGAAASLAGAGAAQTRAVLDELCAAHLLEEQHPGRYAFHDLLRTYASELVHRFDAKAERDSGLSQLMDYYLHSAHAADRLLYPHRDPIVLATARPDVRVEEFAERDVAMTWLATERRSLIAMVTCAAAGGQSAAASRLAWTLAEFLDWQGHWLEQADTQRIALDCARAIRDHAGEAQAHRHLGRALVRLDLVSLAQPHYREAITLFAALGDPAGQAATRLSLAFPLNREGDTLAALDQARRGLRLYRLAGRPYGEAIALNAVGWYFSLLDQCREGLHCCEQALAVQLRIGDLSGQAGTLASIGYVHGRIGDYERALLYYRRSLPILRQTGLRELEADTLVRMGETYSASGDGASAVDALAQALTILDEIDRRTADRVRRELNNLVAAMPEA